MRALYFGTYERDYPRNTEVIASLRDAGVDVVERHAVWEGKEHKFSVGPMSLARLARAELQLTRRPSFDFDVLIVGTPVTSTCRLPAASHPSAARVQPLVSPHRRPGSNDPVT